jgi:hypothetical protein
MIAVKAPGFDRFTAAPAIADTRLGRIEQIFD